LIIHHSSQLGSVSFTCHIEIDDEDICSIFVFVCEDIYAQ